MSTYTQPLFLTAGATKSGQVGNVGYTIRDVNGTIVVARTTAGITEETDASGLANTGAYRVAATLDDAWAFPLRIKWDMTGQSGFVAVDTIDAPVWSRASPGDVAAKLTAQGLTTVRAAKLDNLDATITSRAAPADVTTALSTQGLTTVRAGYLDNLDGIDAQLEAIGDQTARIGSGTIIVQSPVSNSGTVTIYRHYAYKSAQNQEIKLAVTGVDLSGALSVELLDYNGVPLTAGVVSGAGSDNQSVTFELDESVTANLTANFQQWQVRANYPGPDPVLVAVLTVSVK